MLRCAILLHHAGRAKVCLMPSTCQGHPRVPMPPGSTIRELLAALRDPYTRFISPEDFRAMLK